MAMKTVKVDEEVHNEVVAHTQNNDGKIGKFFERAAKEKIERETAGEKAQYDKKLNRIK